MASTDGSDTEKGKQARRSRDLHLELPRGHEDVSKPSPWVHNPRKIPGEWLIKFRRNMAATLAASYSLLSLEFIAIRPARRDGENTLIHTRVL